MPENLIKQYRVFPRAILIFACFLSYDIANWFMLLDDPNHAQAGFASTLGLALVGIVKYYLENGVNHPANNEL